MCYQKFTEAHMHDNTQVRAFGPEDSLANNICWNPHLQVMPYGISSTAYIHFHPIQTEVTTSSLSRKIHFLYVFQLATLSHEATGTLVPVKRKEYHSV